MLDFFSRSKNSITLKGIFWFVLYFKLSLAYSLDPVQQNKPSGDRPPQEDSSATVFRSALKELREEQPEDIKATKQTNLTVGLVAIHPFSYYDVAGNIQGLAFELWQAVARINHYKCNYVLIGQNSNLATTAIQNGSVDVAIGPIGISSDRIKTSDFTVPYFDGQYVLLAKKIHLSFLERLDLVFEGRTVEVLICLILLYALYLHIYWYFERDRIELKGRSYLQVMEILLTLSFVNRVSKPPLFPQTRFVRVASIFWVLACTGTFFTFFAGFTASFVTNITNVDQELSTASSINGKPIAVFGGSTAEHYARHSKLNVVSQPYTVGKAVDLLDAGKVRGVFMLLGTAQSYIEDSKRDDLYISPIEFPHVFFGFLVKEGEPKMLRQINWAIAKLTEDGIKLAICAKYARYINYRNCQ
jgi:ABC-type amino acid transport substrate-binding protein